MIGTVVAHKTWGKGTIVECTESIITVHFSIGDKKFMFPSAFDDYLFTEDVALLNVIAELRAIELKKKSAPVMDDRQTIEKKIKPRHVERSNIAFKCNYCNGGCSDTCVGYKGVCSDAMIRYNIETAKHIWCGSDSLCRKYLSGEITRADLGKEFVCYESTMLTEWKASAGVVQNGDDKGKPMKLLKVQKNSLCVLTTRYPHTTEDARIIFAVFLVDESYEGDGREEGYVTNHSKWRIELKPTEAQKILFWNYYFNKNAPEKIVFGSGLHRYLDDIQAAQILRDIIAVKEDAAGKNLATEFFHHFCKVTGLYESELPPCAGTLKL